MAQSGDLQYVEPATVACRPICQPLVWRANYFLRATLSSCPPWPCSYPTTFTQKMCIETHFACQPIATVRYSSCQKMGINSTCEEYFNMQSMCVLYLLATTPSLLSAKSTVQALSSATCSKPTKENGPDFGP